MKALVTGGAGFIGSHLVDYLLTMGHTVVAVDDMSSGDLNNLDDAVCGMRSRNLTVAAYDFSDPDVLRWIRTGNYDVVFHLAARPRVSYSVEHPAETNMNNVQKTVELMEAVRDGGAKFVFSSSSSVYGGADVLPTPSNYPHSPKSPYAFQKSIIEQYCRMFAELYDMDSVCLRYFNVFGPRAKGDGAYATAVSAWIHAIKNGKPMRSDGDGSQSRDMCYVDNVVRANYKAALSPLRLRGRGFNVACGDRVSNKEILDFLIARYPGAQVTNAPWRPGDVMHTQADISDTERTFGYKPIVTFWNGLEKTLKAEGL